MALFYYGRLKTMKKKSYFFLCLFDFYLNFLISFFFVLCCQLLQLLCRCVIVDVVCRRHRIYCLVLFFFPLLSSVHFQFFIRLVYVCYSQARFSLVNCIGLTLDYSAVVSHSSRCHLEMWTYILCFFVCSFCCIKDLLQCLETAHTSKHTLRAYGLIHSCINFHFNSTTILDRSHFPEMRINL